MVSTYDVLGVVYKHLNVTAVKAAINGGVYNGPEPKGDQKENITINVLNNPGGYVQDGFLNVNIHVTGLRDGRPNLGRFAAIRAALTPYLDGVVVTGAKTVHLDIDADLGPFADQDNAGKHFHNVRINFVTL